MPPQELILSSCSAESSTGKSAGTPSILLHDLLTTSPVHAFKTSTSAVHSLGFVQTENGVGGAVLAVQEGKALVNVWAWQKDQQHLKLHLPEKLSCFTVSANGCWAAGGSSSGHIYLWELASGLLLSSFTAHYRSIVSLTFSRDSHLLISSSLDSAVHVFLVSRLVDEDESNLDGGSRGKPYGTLGDHTLAIRAVEIGWTAGSSGGRCWTASEDGTVKMWSLHPPFDLLATFSLPPSVTPSTLAVDPTERYFYIGTTKGDIYHVPLFRRRGELGANATLAAIEGNNKTDPSIISIGSPITALTLSISSTHLISGTQSGEIHIHSLPSHQHLRTITTHPSPISSIFTFLKPPDLVESSSTGSNTLKSDTWPIMEIKPLERMKASKSTLDGREVMLRLRPRLGDCQVDSLRIGSAGNGGLQPVSRYPIPAEADHGGDTVTSLQAEVKRLKAGLEKAVKINETMWNGIIELHTGPGENIK